MTCWSRGLLIVLFSLGKRITFVVMALLLVGCDHASKHWAEATLRAAHHIELVPGALDLRYTQNPDVAFSLLRAVPESVRFWIILPIGIVAVFAVIALWARQRGMGLTEQLAWALVLAGAAGNLIDRVVRGHVVDFIHLHYWPVFNFADMCIVAGAGLLALLSLRRAKLRRAPPAVD
jgi:signal peptidase II